MMVGSHWRRGCGAREGCLIGVRRGRCFPRSCCRRDITKDGVDAAECAHPAGCAWHATREDEHSRRGYPPSVRWPQSIAAVAAAGRGAYEASQSAQTPSMPPSVAKARDWPPVRRRCFSGAARRGGAAESERTRELGRPSTWDSLTALVRRAVCTAMPRCLGWLLLRAARAGGGGCRRACTRAGPCSGASPPPITVIGRRWGASAAVVGRMMPRGRGQGQMTSPWQWLPGPSAPPLPLPTPSTPVGKPSQHPRRPSKDVQPADPPAELLRPAQPVPGRLRLLR